MASYEYRCAEHAGFVVRLPVGQAPARAACPGCGRPAVRVFTAPHLGRAPSALTRALDEAGRSAERPAVVAQPPRRPGRPRPAAHPRTAGLPRP